MNAFEQFAARQRMEPTIPKHIPFSGQHLTPEYKEHLKKLTLSGMGRDAVVKMTKVSRKTIDRIRRQLRQEGLL